MSSNTEAASPISNDANEESAVWPLNEDLVEDILDAFYYRSEDGESEGAVDDNYVDGDWQDNGFESEEFESSDDEATSFYGLYVHHSASSLELSTDSNVSEEDLNSFEDFPIVDESIVNVRVVDFDLDAVESGFGPLTPLESTGPTTKEHRLSVGNQREAIPA
ncbi:hypothetical protein CYLTODRAFT_441424 [Cylindrobasidium torrendii FP15055 ss-10]|uniref:Uncharacterized protein n=1 Tax=Cylindrobasidium torrendii FP15055 ss-10 TaxID=1314674 RepID=A0A0D7BNP0_9AGAR|nr:hypothetical protein CYLTODRAFT_441424 [Cylindrobasidium torrendii FP15055 ss-10]